MNASRKLLDSRNFQTSFGLIAFCLSFVPSFSIPAWAQSTTAGTISGQVTDQQGASVGDAVVQLIDTSTNGARSTLTNEAGRYDFVNVPPGHYDLTISRQGFAQSKVSGQSVEVGLALTLNVVLRIGTAATTVEVAASAGAANTWKNNHTASPGLLYTPLPKTHRNRFGGAVGGPLLPKLAGGKTYFFANYEGYRYPNATTVEKTVPSALMRAGVIQVPNSSGVYQAYNLNPNAITVNGVTYQPVTCSDGAACDPRGIGLNPIVNQIWSKYMPLPNDPQFGDQYNTQGYLTPIKLPQSSDFGVVRLDHDFGARNHFTASDRYYTLSQLTSNQVDIGGALPGDTFGQAAASSPRPQKANYFVAGLTTNITPSVTNDFHFNYVRSFWAWSTAGGTPQLPGLGGAVEIGEETSAR